MTNKYQKPTGSYISFMSNKVKTYGGINLAQGIPGFQPPAKLIEILQEVSRENIHQYPAGNGNLKLQQLIQQHYAQYLSLDLKDIMVTQGATEALSLLYTYFTGKFGKDFSALAFSPVYESYKHLPRIFNTGFSEFQLENNEIDFDKLKQTIVQDNVKVVFISSPGNPYGKMFTKPELDTLLKLAEELDFYILFDAVYKELYFEEAPYQPLESLNPRLFYINSFSKMLSVTGWRIGYFFAHPEHMEAIKSIHDYTGLCASSVMQEAIAEYLVQHNYGANYIENLRERLKKNFAYFREELLKLDFYIPETHGGYFVWTRLPEQFNDGFKFAIDLYEQEKVAVIPGEHFSAHAQNYIRLNIAREDEEINEGIKHIQRFVKR